MKIFYLSALNHKASIPSNYDTVKDTAQVATMLRNIDEASLSQEGMQKTDTKATCQHPRKFNTYQRKTTIYENICKLQYDLDPK